jgi:hypothetical protein
VSANVPSPALPDTLAAAAKALLQLAASSLARSAAISSTVSTPTTQTLLQQLAATVQQGPVAAAQQQLVAVSQLIASDLEAWPGLQAAQLGVAAVDALHQAVAVEGLTAVAALRLAEVSQWRRRRRAVGDREVEEGERSSGAQGGHPEVE